MRIKALLILTVLLLIFGLLNMACQPEEEIFDQQALIMVDDYVIKITEAILAAQPDLLGWVRAPYSDNLPLEYDGERQEWLLEHKLKLEAIRKQHLGEAFPAREEIALWQVVVVRGDQEWLLEGPVLVDALANLEELTVDLIGTIEMIIENDGKLDLTQSDQVLKLIDRIEPEIEEVRYVLFR